MERAMTILTGEIQAQLMRCGIELSHSQLVVIQVLDIEEGISASRLATFLTKDRAAVKRTVDSLVAKGYLERRKKDRKESGLYLTEAGRGLLPEMMKAIDATRSKYFDGIAPEHVETVAYVCSHVNEVKARETAGC